MCVGGGGGGVGEEGGGMGGRGEMIHERKEGDTKQ